jgi:SAM-dependent methyltransferase
MEAISWSESVDASGDTKLQDPVCRFCASGLRHVFVDLGMSPLANGYVTRERLNEMEAFFPLRAYVCERCFLVQLQEFANPREIFRDYAYFSSYSDSWLEHCRAYADRIVPRFGLNGGSQVIELASNDGYLLQYFVTRGIRVLGIEPAANVAEAAQKKSIPTIVRFFGTELARELVESGVMADLLVGNNVLAHTPALHDFVAGMKLVLKPQGVITMEFPHLLRLITEQQFDTIYHEHFSYFSFLTVERIFAAHGLSLFDVEELPTHGGSLRIYGHHSEDTSRLLTSRVSELRAREEGMGLSCLDTYLDFSERVKATKRDLLQFLITAKAKGHSVVGYGAAAKGNTLLNYCGIRSDFIDYIVDRSPHKQGLYLPGTSIPVYGPEKISETKPDYLLILPWNLKKEIMSQMAFIREWGGQFVVPIPEVRIL